MAQKTKKFNIFKLFRATALSILLAVTVQSGSAHAQNACDPQFMDAIEARGFAEAARENAQNQNLMFKPDSVFEYSCFRSHASLPQVNADQLFRPASLSFPTVNPIEQFVFTNFGDVYLDSRYTTPIPALPAPPANMCNAIASVWEVSRCMNFYNRQDLEGFFDLTHYTANDPRQLPTSLGACPTLPYGGLNMALDMAYNNNRPAWTLAIPNPRDTTDYISDPVDVLEGMYEPGTCGTEIPTGMIVTDYTAPVNSFREKICSNPACVYTPSGYDAGSCSMP